VIKAAHLVLARLHIERIWDKNVTYWLAHECAKGNDHAALEAMVAEGLPGLWAEDGAGHVPLHYARELQRAACVAILEDLQRKRRAKKKGKKAKKKNAGEPAEQEGAGEGPDSLWTVTLFSLVDCGGRACDVGIRLFRVFRNFLGFCGQPSFSIAI
jgi:hypothetical protein